MNHSTARALAALYSSEDGQALVEYTLVLVLVSIAAIALLSAVGAFPSSIFSKLNADF